MALVGMAHRQRLGKSLHAESDQKANAVAFAADGEKLQPARLRAAGDCTAACSWSASITAPPPSATSASNSRSFAAR
jgi:hypothetical protein